MAGFGEAVKEIDEFTPSDGFNVVGVDPYEPLGEALYLVAHVCDAAEAERRRAAHAENTGNATYVTARRSTNYAGATSSATAVEDSRLSTP